MNLILFTILTVLHTEFAVTTGRNLAKHVNALIVVDVQNCFITGNLALSKTPAGQDAMKFIPILNDLIQNIPFNIIVYTHDWHPRDHISFYDALEARRIYLKDDQNRTINLFEEVTYIGPKVETEQVLWPSHCIQNTDDAALHKDLYVPSTGNNVIHVRKGTDPDIDSYSAFWDNKRAHKTELETKLRERNVTHVFVAGLVMDYCVGATALDALDLNYTTYVVDDATGMIAVDTANTQRDKLKQRGAYIIESSQVRTLISSGSPICWSVILIFTVNLFIFLLK